MTRGELKTLCFHQFAENPLNPKFLTAAEVEAALNSAQRTFCALTLCLEGSASLVIAPNAITGDLSSLTGFVAVRSVHVQGWRLDPGTVEEFAALDPDWSTRNTGVRRYACFGWNTLLVNPPQAGGVTLDVRYARTAVNLAADNSVPEIDAEYHEALAHWAMVLLAGKFGGHVFKEAAASQARFVQACSDCARKVYARAIAEDWDVAPKLDEKEGLIAWSIVRKFETVS